MADDAHWLIWSNEHRAWWRPNSAGYTGDEAKAGRYTFADALARCRDDRGPLSWDARTGPYEVMVPAPEALDAMRALPALYEALANATVVLGLLHIKFDEDPNKSRVLTEARAALSLARGKTEDAESAPCQACNGEGETFMAMSGETKGPREDAKRLREVQDMGKFPCPLCDGTGRRTALSLATGKEG